MIINQIGESIQATQSELEKEKLHFHVMVPVPYLESSQPPGETCYLFLIARQGAFRMRQFFRTKSLELQKPLLLRACRVHSLEDWLIYCTKFKKLQSFLMGQGRAKGCLSSKDFSETFLVTVSPHIKNILDLFHKLD